MLEESLKESYPVHMLIDLLLRFPEIYTITFNLPSSACSLSFIVKRQLGGKEFSELRQRLRQNLEALYFLRHSETPCDFKVVKNRYAGLTRIQIHLKADAFSGDSISLLTNTVLDFFQRDLVDEADLEEGGCLPALERPSEETVDRAPLSARNRRSSRYFAFRDAGKVYIYDM